MVATKPKKPKKPIPGGCKTLSFKPARDKPADVLVIPRSERSAPAAPPRPPKPPEIIPEFPTPPGVESICLDVPCSACGDYPIPNRLTREVDGESVPIARVRFGIFDVAVPALSIIEVDGIEYLDVWLGLWEFLPEAEKLWPATWRYDPARSIFDCVFSWVCPDCWNLYGPSGAPDWADKIRRKRDEKRREREAQARWEASVAEECAAQLHDSLRSRHADVTEEMQAVKGELPGDGPAARLAGMEE